MLGLLSFPSLLVSIKDLLNLKNPIYKNEVHIKAALEWLKYAQDVSGDGGVASWYSFDSSWGPSYIETSGYIINTFLDCYKYFNDKELKVRAIKIADFLLSMQLPNGGFRSETPKQKKKSKPVIFDTGQDIIGLTDIYKATKNQKYLKSAVSAADFLCSVQNKDGSWTKYAYRGLPHSYETRTAWSLLKVYELTKKNNYLNHALKNLEWAEKNMLKNGWFKKSFLLPQNPKIPYTHAISYIVEGFLWSGLILDNEKYIKIAEKAVTPMLLFFNKHNFLSGAFDQNWKSVATYTCLTGDAQISLMWLKLFTITRDNQYLMSAKKMNTFLKSTQDLKTKNKNIKGAIKGSYPVYGDLITRTGYCRMAYINWGAKFFIDTLLEEIIIDQKHD